MITYSVKKNKRTRYTFRLTGIFFILIPLIQFILFFRGYGRKHIIGMFLCLLIFIYGIYLIVHSFKKTSYDIQYEFRDEDFSVLSRKGETKYSYSQVDDISLIVPENEMVYSIIHLTAGKDDFVIPFSYKKEFCDRLYTYVNERVTAAKLEQEIDK
jgi:hypothetical protein